MAELKREALVVGINNYPLLPKDKNLKNAANDAEEIAKILEKYGKFKVQHLPKNYAGEKRGVHPDPFPEEQVTEKILEDAIAHLFNDTTLDTALLFFAGHGLYNEKDREGFLATSDTNKPDKWGVSLRWLRQILQKSPVKEQIVWLDCCHSGALFNSDEVDLRTGESNRCLISACRYDETIGENGNHGIFTSNLLEGLKPEDDANGWVTNYNLGDFIEKKFAQKSQHPIVHNSGKYTIILTDKDYKDKKPIDPNLVGECPYKALESFTEKDAIFFYGRTELTEKLIEKVRKENFVAVLGASGSGKSSVLRAGLLYQLKRGQKLSGSDRWKYYEPFTPGENPLESLGKAIGESLPDLSGKNQIKKWVKWVKKQKELPEEQRVILVIDQFEECFTLYDDDQERKQFFKYLLRTVTKLENKICLVLGMRADFLGKCLEYGELANKIDDHQVLVKPMTEEEIEEVIEKPAQKVGLKVEPALVVAMTKDVIDYPGSLPLLQSALTELWKETRKDTNPNRDRLMRETYNKLGEQKFDQKDFSEQESSHKKPSVIEKIFSNMADEVFNSLRDPEKPKELSKEQLVAQRIFLELVKVSDVSDTRKRAILEELPNTKQDETTLRKVVDILVKKRLITANYSKEQKATILDIVHESLIRHWTKLHEWLNKNRAALQIEDKIETRAKDWQKNGKKDDLDWLLQGAALIEAENLQDRDKLGLLDGLVEEYIEHSKKVRDREEESQKKQIEKLEKALAESQMREQSTRMLNLLPVEPSEALALAIDTMGLNFQQLPKEEPSYLQDLAEYTHKILGVVKFSLHEVMTKARLLYTFEEDSSYTQAVAFSPDGKMIVSGGYNQSLRLWDIYGNQIALLRGHNEAITAVAFSPDGEMIVSGSRDRTLRLWNINGDLIGKQPWKGHEDWVNAVAFSPNGKMIVSVSNDKTLRLWDINGNLIGEPLRGHENHVSSVAFSPDRKTIVSGSWDNTVRLWDINKHLDQSHINPNPLRFLRNQFKRFKKSNDNSIAQLWCCKDEHWVNAVAFSPDGKMIVSGSDDNTLRLWDVDGNPIGEPLRGHTGAVNAVAFSPNGKMIVSGSDDKTLRLWDIDGKPIGEPLRGHIGDVKTVAFSPDGQIVVSGADNDNLRLWDIDSNLIVKQLGGHEGSINAVAFSPDGQMIVSGGDYNKLCLWDIRSRDIDDVKPVVLNRNNDERSFSLYGLSITAVAFSPDGQKFISASKEDSYLFSESKNSTLCLWDIEGKPIGEPWQGYQKAISAVAFSPDGQMVISGSWDKTLRLWDINGNQIGEPWQGHDDRVKAVAFSPNGQMVVSGSYTNPYISGSDDHNLLLWDINDNPIGQPLRGHKGDVNAVAFSPDGTTIVSGGDDNTLRLWNIKGEPIGQPWRGHEDSVNAVAFSPDGQMIVSGSKDKTLRLWDMNGNEIIQPLRGHEDSVNAVAFSQDGQMIVSGSSGWNNNLRLWPAGNWQTWLQVCCDRFAYHLMWKYPEIDLAYNEKGSDSEGVSSDQNPQRIDGTISSQNDENSSANNQTPEFDIAQRACKVCVEYKVWKDADLSKISQQQGNILARRGQVEEAIAKFQQALKYDPTLELDPHAEVQQLGVPALVNQGRELAKQLEIDSAIAKFQQALKYDPTLELDPQAEAQKLAASTLLQKGAYLARQGQVEEAIAHYDQAQAFHSTLDVEILAVSWNQLCWYGTLHGYANNPKIMAAGEEAVKHKPENGDYRDTRGLARASVGNFEGVIEDFQAFINWTDNEKKKLQRQRWIDDLLAGENPITPEELNKLLN